MTVFGMQEFHSETIDPHKLGENKNHVVTELAQLTLKGNISDANQPLRAKHANFNMIHRINIQRARRS